MLHCFFKVDCPYQENPQRMVPRNRTEIRRSRTKLITVFEMTRLTNYPSMQSKSFIQIYNNKDEKNAIPIPIYRIIATFGLIR